MPSSSSSSGGAPVRNEFVWDKNPDQLISATKILLDNLNKYKMIHEWVFAIRQSRHPGFLWEIDYIKPSNSLIKINKMIMQSENILFDSNDSIMLKPQFSADPEILNFFNIIRAYIKAENGNIDKSIEMWISIYNSQIGYLSKTRQSNILCHMHSVFLCAGNFEKSFSCFMKHLTLLKISTHKEQQACGMWDNISLMNIIQYFFSKHVPQYRTFLSQKVNCTERSLLVHKKTALLKFTNIQLIVQTCSKPFFDHAKTLFADIPEYDESSFIKSTPTKQQRANTFYEMKYKQALSDSEYASKEEIKAIEWSMWHESTEEYDKKHKSNKLIKTNNFIEFLKNTDVNYHSVIDIGCGTCDDIYTFFENKNLTGVDISPFVVDYWAEKGRPIIKDSAEAFFENNDKNFDMCIAAYVLPALYPIDKFLYLCSKKCKNLCAAVLFGMWLRPTPVDITQLALTVKSKDEWIEQISEYFDIKLLEDNSTSIILHATSKYYDT